MRVACESEGDREAHQKVANMDAVVATCAGGVTSPLIGLACHRVDVDANEVLIFIQHSCRIILKEGDFGSLSRCELGHGEPGVLAEATA